MEACYETLKINLFNAGILQITLNRPNKLNTLTNQLLSELETILLSAKTNPAVKALLFT